MYANFEICLKLTQQRRGKGKVISSILVFFLFYSTSIPAFVVIFMGFRFAGYGFWDEHKSKDDVQEAGCIPEGKSANSSYFSELRKQVCGERRIFLWIQNVEKTFSLLMVGWILEYYIFIVINLDILLYACTIFSCSVNCNINKVILGGWCKSVWSEKIKDHWLTCDDNKFAFHFKQLINRELQIN